MQWPNNRKGNVTQNCLVCCSFDIEFQHIVNGYRGSTADATIYSNSYMADLPIPAGKYYVAEAGFVLCDALLVSYHNVRYHFAE